MVPGGGSTMSPSEHDMHKDGLVKSERMLRNALSMQRYSVRGIGVLWLRKICWPGGMNVAKQYHLRSNAL